MKRIDAVLQENAQNQEAVFVFPSEVAASAWADRFLQISGAGAVAMERFKAWDTFKGDSVRAREQDKTSIPPALRKLFALNLLYENAALCRAGDPPVFRSLVNPQYAHSASSFAPWIASLLPPLALYVERRRTPAGDEDRDLFALAAHYREFLAENNLFEPAWEKPPLDTGGKQVFIFYPELLEDFIDYETLLASAPSVTIVRSPRADTRPECRVFPNSRAELRAAAMHIRRLVDEGLDWQEIALSVPDGDTYGPYLQRELELYGIPVVNHIGKTLAAYPAGAFFPDIQRCEAEEFSWTALCRLLLNRHLPWKDAGAIRQLIDFGRRSICVNHTAWTDAFAGPAGAVEQRAAGFYTQIREHLTALVRAKSFGGMQRAYFAFRERFFIPPADSETDLILSRCVSELTELVNLENAWPRVRCPSPFAFFCRHLREKIYVPAQPRAGVGLFPFRLAAAAPFGCHIVVGASQKGITVIFSRLNFLGERLRASLGMADRDGSADFIAQYTRTSRCGALFLCSQETFSGYAVPHGALDALPTEGPASPWTAERDFFASGAAFPQVLFPAQKAGFQAWAEARESAPAGPLSSPPQTASATAPLEERIRAACLGEGELAGKVRVSATALRDYRTCPRFWLNTHVLGITADDPGMPPAIPAAAAGSIYHAVLERFFRAVQENSAGGILAPPELSPDSTPRLSAEYEALLDEALEQVLTEMPIRNVPSPVGVKLLRAQENTLRLRLRRFLAAFLTWFAGCRVLAAEKHYRFAPAEAEYFLSGTIDLVLAQDGAEGYGTIIVDFKTGGMPTPGDAAKKGGAELRDFQLPVYSLLYNAPVEAALFFSITQAKPQVLFGSIAGGIEGKPHPKNPIRRGDERYGAIMAETQEKIAEFARAVLSGSAARDAASVSLHGPAHPDWQTCEDCAFRFSCRLIWTVGAPGVPCPL